MRVLEAKRDIAIDVTQEDIDKGISCSSTACAIARAARRLFPELDAVSINRSVTYLTLSGVRSVRYMNGRDAWSMIGGFDTAGVPTKPGIVILRAPRKSETRKDRLDRYYKARVAGTDPSSHTRESVTGKKTRIPVVISLRTENTRKNAKASVALVGRKAEPKRRKQ